MSTGAVAPFTPNGPTQNVIAAASSAVATFQPCDAVLLYNSDATIKVFVSLGTALEPPVGSLTASVPIPPGQMLLLGTGDAGDSPTSQITKLAYIAASAPTGALYITPGLGTQH